MPRWHVSKCEIVVCAVNSSLPSQQIIRNAHVPALIASKQGAYRAMVAGGLVS